MTSDAFFALMCMSMFGLLFGFVLAFSGYRFFLFLLPIWGFFFGFGFGAQTIQFIFGTGFLSDVTSWVVGFFVALIFAVLSYLFYIFAVAMIAGSLGYGVGAAIILAIMPNFGFLAWVVGVVIGVLFAIAVITLNIQKYVIIFATGIQGAAIIVGVFIFMLGGIPSSEIFENPVQTAFQNSPWWTIIFLVVTALGIVAQIQTTQRWEVETYNRWDEMSPPGVGV